MPLEIESDSKLTTNLCVSKGGGGAESFGYIIHLLKVSNLKISVIIFV